jgi:hypothetical protein
MTVSAVVSSLNVVVGMLNEGTIPEWFLVKLLK